MNHRTKFFIVTSIVATILFGAPVVFAHANLVRSEPAADSAQSVPPPVVRLWFSEDVEPRLTSLSVNDTNRQPVDKGDSHRLPDDPKGMEVSLRDLPRGLYTVVWHAVSAVDGHSTAGSFVFTVGDKPLAEASPRQIISQVQAELSVRELPPMREIIVRWLNLLTIILLTGSFAFPLLILFPSAPTLPSPVVDGGGLGRGWRVRWLQFAATALVFCAVMAVAILMNQVISVGGDTGSLVTILLATRFGYVWLFRVAVLIALGVLLARAQFDAASPRAWWLGAGLCILLVISQSLDSHGAAVSDPPIIPLLTDIAHLLGAAIWVGGLAQLLVTVPSFLKSLDGETRAQTLAALIARFSLVAFITVVVIALTGAFATFVQVGSFEAFFGTLYGTSLFFKIALMIPLLLLAALNLIVTRPALARTVAERADGIIRRFNIAVVFEILFAVAILFIVGILTSTAPGRAAYDPSPKLWLDTHRVDDLSITLAASPALIGPNDFDVYLRDASGQPVSDATVVRLLGTMREMNMGTQELTTTPQGHGHYTLRSNLFSMAGTWDVQVLARRAGYDDARSTFTIFAYTQALPPTQPTVEIALTERPIQIGLGLTLFGLAFGTASALLLKQRNMRWAGMVGAIVVSSIGAVAVTQTPIAQPAAPVIVIPIVPEFARLTRMPFRIDDQRVASGREIYLNNCATCHGATGKGDGPSAPNLNPKPINFTVHVPLHTDGELYWWVTNGIPGSAMPSWAKSLTDQQRWEVIAYLRRTFQGDATPTPAP